MSTFGGFSGFGQSSNQPTGGFGSTNTNPAPTGEWPLLAFGDCCSSVFRNVHFVALLDLTFKPDIIFPYGQASVQALGLRLRQPIRSGAEVLQLASGPEVGRIWRH